MTLIFQEPAMFEKTYWIAFGDIHDDLSRLGDIPEMEGAAGVIVTGDITFAGGISQAKKVLDEIAAQTPMLFAQIGNMDKAEITGWLEQKGWNLHRRAKPLFPGVVAFGVGCSPFTPFNTPSEHPEQLLYQWMEEAREEAVCLLNLPEHALKADDKRGPHMVLVAHSPPHASACDRLGDGTPVGSTAVREFIERYHPDICLCGHIHESRAEDRIGHTHVINPGTLASGGYILLHMENELHGTAIKAELKTI